MSTFEGPEQFCGCISYNQLGFTRVLGFWISSLIVLVVLDVLWKHKNLTFFPLSFMTIYISGRMLDMTSSTSQLCSLASHRLTVVVTLVVVHQ